MTALELSNSAAGSISPPPNVSTAVRALWFARAGKWEVAHDLCQEIQGKEGSWIHAYLHRVEGDLSNARYWYARAEQPVPDSKVALEDEWLEIVTILLESGRS